MNTKPSRTSALWPIILLASAAAAQNLSGTLTAADTGAPIPLATILAIQTGIPPSQRPLVVRAVTDANGAYMLTVQPGQ
jgi:hypothetical protein